MSDNNTNETYYSRLINWNATSKYAKEVDFLKSLLDLNSDDQVLDFGCGTGFCLETLQRTSDGVFWGYDVNLFFEHSVPDWFLKDYSLNRYTKIYLMHSIAHLPDVLYTLKKIVNCLEVGGRLVIITPNKDYDDYFKQKVKTEHKRDSTVVGHFTQENLVNIISEIGLNVLMVGQFGDMVDKYNERIFLIAQKKA